VLEKIKEGVGFSMLLRVLNVYRYKLKTTVFGKREVASRREG